MTSAFAAILKPAPSRMPPSTVSTPLRGCTNPSSRQGVWVERAHSSTRIAPMGIRPFPTSTMTNIARMPSGPRPFSRAAKPEGGAAGTVAGPGADGPTSVIARLLPVVLREEFPDHLVVTAGIVVRGHVTAALDHGELRARNQRRVVACRAWHGFVVRTG